MSVPFGLYGFLRVPPSSSFTLRFRLLRSFLDLVRARRLRRRMTKIEAMIARAMIMPRTIPIMAPGGNLELNC